MYSQGHVTYQWASLNMKSALYTPSTSPTHNPAAVSTIHIQLYLELGNVALFCSPLLTGSDLPEISTLRLGHPLADGRACVIQSIPASYQYYQLNICMTNRLYCFCMQFKLTKKSASMQISYTHRSGEEAENSVLKQMKKDLTYMITHNINKWSNKP